MNRLMLALLALVTGLFALGTPAAASARAANATAASVRTSGDASAVQAVIVPARRLVVPDAATVMTDDVPLAASAARRIGLTVMIGSDRAHL